MTPDDESTLGPDGSLGEPIAELAGHVVPVPAHLKARVRGSIFRRTLAGDVTRFATWGPITALMELLKAIFESLGRPQEDAPTDESEEA